MIIGSCTTSMYHHKMVSFTVLRIVSTGRCGSFILCILFWYVKHLISNIVHFVQELITWEVLWGLLNRTKSLGVTNSKGSGPWSNSYSRLGNYVAAGAMTVLIFARFPSHFVLFLVFHGCGRGVVNQWQRPFSAAVSGPVSHSY